MILAQLLVVFFGCMFLARTSSLVLIFFIVLSVYSIVPQIGYEFFPELSISLEAYFGDGIKIYYQIFFLSNLLIMPLALYLAFRVNLSLKLPSRIKGLPGQAIFRLFFFTYFGIMWCIFFLFEESINYFTASSMSGRNVFIFMFPILNKYAIGLAIVSNAYAKINRLNGFINLVAIASIIFFAYKLGARSDIVALSLGLAFYWASVNQPSFRGLVQLVIAASVIIVGLFAVEASRNASTLTAMSFSLVDILSNDYLAPGHTVFGLIYYNYVDPMGQLVSNFVNMFPGANSFFPGEYPLLSEKIGGLIAGKNTVISRTQGYAFHLLGEGYAFFGMWGAIYNFIAVWANFAFYKFIANSLDHRSRTIFWALVVTLIFGLVRSQFSMFPKLFITYLVPIMALVLVFNSTISKGNDNGS